MCHAHVVVMMLASIATATLMLGCHSSMLGAVLLLMSTHLAVLEHVGTQDLCGRPEVTVTLSGW